MKKLLTLALTLIFVLSLTACNKGDTSSDNSSTVEIQGQTDVSETDTSAEQSSDTATESDTDNKTENASSNTNSDKKNENSNSTTQTPSTPKPTTSTQTPSTQTPSTTTPSTQTPSTTTPTTPSTPTTLNPKTDLKYGTYTAEFVDNDGKIYHFAAITLKEGVDSISWSRSNYYRQDYWTEEVGSFDENNFNITEIVTFNGTKYYKWDSDGTVYDCVITDTNITTNSKYDEKYEFSIYAAETLTLEKDHKYFGKAGTKYFFEKW